MCGDCMFKKYIEDEDEYVCSCEESLFYGIPITDTDTCEYSEEDDG